MLKSDPIKQVSIMAQSAMRLAVELAIAQGDFDLPNIGKTANTLMDYELRLAGKYEDTFRKIQDVSRRKDLDELFNDVVDRKTLFNVWKQLSADEQVEYKDQFEKLNKKYK